MIKIGWKTDRFESHCYDSLTIASHESILWDIISWICVFTPEMQLERVDLPQTETIDGRVFFGITAHFLHIPNADGVADIGDSMASRFVAMNRPDYNWGRFAALDHGKL